jgi:hypothetical protein
MSHGTYLANFCQFTSTAFFSNSSGFLVHNVPVHRTSLGLSFKTPITNLQFLWLSNSQRSRIFMFFSRQFSAGDHPYRMKAVSSCVKSLGFSNRCTVNWTESFDAPGRVRTRQGVLRKVGWAFWSWFERSASVHEHGRSYSACCLNIGVLQGTGERTLAFCFDFAKTPAQRCWNCCLECVVKTQPAMVWYRPWLPGFFCL